METGYLKHVTNVLESMGYSLDGGTYSDWDILWSHEYPFSDANLKQVISNLKPHQKVSIVSIYLVYLFSLFYCLML